MVTTTVTEIPASTGDGLNFLTTYAPTGNVRLWRDGVVQKQKSLFSPSPYDFDYSGTTTTLQRILVAPEWLLIQYETTAAPGPSPSPSPAASGILVSQIILEAFRENGIFANGEPPEPSDLVTGLFRFNMMVDAFKAERLMIYKTLRSTFNTVANTQEYSIGPGATWDTPTRPLAIVRASFVNTYISANSPLETPIHIYNDEEWAGIVLKSMTNTIVWGLWYETSFSNAAPLGSGNIFLYPIPTVVAKIGLYLPVPIDEVASDETGLASTLYLPPGYRNGMVRYLAVDLADAYGEPANASLVAKMNKAMRLIRRSNTKPMTLPVPKGLHYGSGRRGYNILTNNSQ